MSPLAKVTLETLDLGGAVEQVNHVLEEAWKNIDDANTDATGKRVITLTIELKPDKTRELIQASYAVTKKFPGPRKRDPVSVFMGMQGGLPAAYTRDLRQRELLPEDQPPTDVVPMSHAQHGGRK